MQTDEALDLKSAISNFSMDSFRVESASITGSSVDEIEYRTLGRNAYGAKILESVIDSLLDGTEYFRASGVNLQSATHSH